MINFTSLLLVFFLLNQIVSDQSNYQKCYKTDWKKCSEKNKDVPIDNSEYQKAMYKCFKELKEEKVTCSYGQDRCLRANLIYKGGDYLILLDCGSQDDSECTSLYRDKIVNMAEKELVGGKNCTYCEKNYCNSKTEKVETEKVETEKVETEKVKTSTVLSVRKTNAPSNQKNKSTEILPNMVVLMFLVSISVYNFSF